jgi:hypothetical protein
MLLKCVPPFCIGSLYLVGCLVLLPWTSYAASIDDYLSRIEEEAKNQATAPVTSKSESNLSILNATERLPLGLPQEEFERVLQKQYIGTYLFYQRLTPENKRQIFKLYRQDNRVSTIREKTLKLLSESTL